MFNNPVAPVGRSADSQFQQKTSWSVRMDVRFDYAPNPQTTTAYVYVRWMCLLVCVDRLCLLF
jgi:hypothetical protein